jgi:hypothetical protein
MKRTITFLLLIITVYTINNLAQSAGGGLMLGFPQGEFKENIDRLGFGVSGQFLLFDPSERLPFGFGLDVGYLNYGSESRREPFSPTIPDVIVDVNRTNNLVNFHLLFHIAPPSGMVRPYLELLFGGAYLWTETTINSRGDEEVAGNTNFDDFAWNYGAGGGLLINVYTPDNPEDNIKSLFLDLKIRYLFGTEAEYLKEGSVTIRNEEVYYDVSKSKTDLLLAQLGVMVYFNSFVSDQE